jgi:putative membrane protein
MYFLLRLLATAVAVWVATKLVPGITYSGSLLGLVGVALVFGFMNAIIRPILFFLTCPLVLVTLGLFVFVLNAFMLMLTSAVASSLGLDFHVSGFIPALLGALVIGLVSALLNAFVGEPPQEGEPHREERQTS